jgi:two-component system chemotaxis response regulator CheB
MSKIRVLIVDDSSFMRMVIRGFLTRDPEIEVVGVAANGAEGVSKAAQLKPDVITMDMEMPVMDGITAVRQIMATTPTKVIMVSTLTCAGATATFEALEAGAIDYVPKNTTDSPGNQELFRSELLRKIKEAAHATFSGRNISLPTTPTGAPVVEKIPASGHSRRFKYVGIGASTGGPTALLEVLSRLPATFPHAIMVAIHMPQAFTGPYAERLNSKCKLPVKEAADGDLLRPGQIFIAPGGKHATLVRRPEGVTVRLSPVSDHPRCFYVPSVDLMLSSLAEAAGGPVLGVILTGMGNDGFKGMQQIKSKGGKTLVQDESTSTIFGMPRACIEGNIADDVLPLTQIGPAIDQLAAG